MAKVLLFYINAIHEGGAERVIIQLAKHFAENGYKSILVTSFIDKNEYIVPENVIRLSLEGNVILQSRLKKNIFRIVSLRRLCKKYNPVAVISFMAEPNYRAILATFGLPTKTVISVRNDPQKEYAGKLGHFLASHLLPMADGCVFQTDEAKRWFSLKLQRKSRVIFNDVDPVFFKTEYVGGKDIVALGRLTEQKNHEMLIKAFKTVHDKYPKEKLKIYGNGHLQNTLKQLIKELDLSDVVELAGLTTNAPEVLAHCKQFVLSSDYEGMPNALMEAMAIGVPSISTDCPCGGPKMLIENEVTGLLTPVGDSRALADAMMKYLSNESLAITIGKNAREQANKYKSDAIFLEWKDFVESIICQHNP